MPALKNLGYKSGMTLVFLALFSIISQVSYTSAELVEALPFWVADGHVISRTDALDLVKRKNGKACTLWVMNFSNDKSLSKVDILNRLVKAHQPLEEWKRVSGKAIFTDTTGNFALSYNCVQKDENGQLIELNYINDFEFNNVFKNILEIR